MTIVKWIAAVLAIGYLGGLALLYVKQRAMLFPIPPVGRTAPAAAGLPEAEEHVLTTADGENVIIWHVPAKPSRPVILFFPGNGDFLAGCVSYRGYAGSSGEPSEQGLLQDAAAVYAFTTARYAPERIVAWGFSLGTGVAVAIAAEHPVSKLILEAPYTSTADVVAPRYWFAPVRLLMRDQFHSDRRIARVTVPLLIMHGTSDTTIPITFGQRLFALAREPKQFVPFPGGGHDNLEQYGAIDTAKRFIGG